MSAETVQMFQAGLRCNHAGCNVSIWRVAPGSDLAETVVQRDASLNGWSISSDRTIADYDLCPDHARAVRAGIAMQESST